MYEVTVQAEFSAAHRLRNYHEDLHGHNWKVSVTVGSERLDDVGMVIDFRKLKERLSEVLGGLDHKYLNDLPYFKKLNPTSENIARYVYEKLRSDQIKEVTVWETDTAWASYKEKR